MTEEQKAALPKHWYPIKQIPDAFRSRPSFLMAKRVGGLASVFEAWWHEDPNGKGGVWNANKSIIDFHKEMTEKLLATFDHEGQDPSEWFRGSGS